MQPLSAVVWQLLACAKPCCCYTWPACRYLYLCCPAWQFADCVCVLVSTLMNEDYYYIRLGCYEEVIGVKFAGRDITYRRTMSKNGSYLLQSWPLNWLTSLSTRCRVRLQIWGRSCFYNVVRLSTMQFTSETYAKVSHRTSPYLPKYVTFMLLCFEDFYCIFTANMYSKAIAYVRLIRL